MMINLQTIGELNDILREKESIIRIIAEDNCKFFSISLSSNQYVKSCIVNATDEFYLLLEDFFNSKNIKISYNNTRNIFRQVVANNN